MNLFWLGFKKLIKYLNFVKEPTRDKNRKLKIIKIVTRRLQLKADKIRQTLPGRTCGCDFFNFVFVSYSETVLLCSSG